MKAIKNIKVEDIKSASKKARNNTQVGKDTDGITAYTDGFEDGVNYMRQMAEKEISFLRRRIEKLKDVILNHKRATQKLEGTVKKLARKLGGD